MESFDKDTSSLINDYTWAFNQQEKYKNVIGQFIHMSTFKKYGCYKCSKLIPGEYWSCNWECMWCYLHFCLFYYKPFRNYRTRLMESKCLHRNKPLLHSKRKK